MTKPPYDFAFHKQVKEASSPWDEEVSFGVYKGSHHIASYPNPQPALDHVKKLGPGHSLIRFTGKTGTHKWDHLGKLIDD